MEMHAHTASPTSVADRCSDIRALVVNHVETHKKKLGDHRCEAFQRALARDDLERVHDLLVESLFVLMETDAARRLLGDVAFDCGDAMGEDMPASLH